MYFDLSICAFIPSFPSFPVNTTQVFFLTLILYIYTYVGQVLCIFNDFIIIISPLLDIVTQHTV